MAPNINKTQKQQASKEAIGALPEPLQQLFLSGQSVQNLAHLAKNILQMTSGAVEIIELGLERKQFDRVERSWDIFETNFIRMKKFVLNLIKYTKHYPLQKTICDPNRCADDAIRSCEYALKSGVKIKLQKDKTIPLMSLDADRVEEMVANLITHALDNLPEHCGTIFITTKCLKDHRQVQVSVGDDGPALTNETIQSLSKPLERMPNMIGTGFDIPLAKLHIEQHEGYMEFESNEPKGNCVHAYLPIQ
ncbi:MAG: hypothetical protein DRP52_00400 [Planctomycetota bacterium]|nr:MAG: hypothetical protein DRP52_00400 [Planctomycetota bacterium]